MNYLNTTAIAVFGFVFAGSMNTANAAEVNVNLDDNVNNPGAHIQIQGTDKTAYNLDNIEGSNIKQDGQIYNLQGDIDRANTAINKAQDTANTAQDGVNANTQANAILNQKVDDNKADQTITDNKQNILIDNTNNKADAALQGVITNGQAIIDTNTRVDKAELTATNANNKADANTQALAGKVDKSIFDADQDRQDHALQDASDKATQAFNTGTYAQSLAVDAQTVAAANKAAVANVQSRQQAQETTIQNHSAQLANHESRITALESQNNAKFSSLENQQNEDRKEYRAGIAGAASLAGLHYVDTDNAVAVGAANFKDAQGYAVGYRHKFAENIAATLSTSGTSNGDEIVAASASYGWWFNNIKSKCQQTANQLKNSPLSLISWL